MKRTICLILSAVLLFGLCACSQDRDNFQQPVIFYYTHPEELISFNSEEGVVSSEMREGKNYTNDLQGLLDLYLCGPVSDELRSPFPAGVNVQTMVPEGNTLQITLSPEFAKLTGLDLTIACACLSMTVLELTEYEAVRIDAADALLDESNSITMTWDSLLRLDIANVQEDAA